MDYAIIGFQVTVMGLGAVFLALGALATLLNMQSWIMLKKRAAVVRRAEAASKEVSVQQEEVRSRQQGASPENELVDTELVVIITAAVTQTMARQSGYTPQIRITSIAPASDVWRMRGRGNLISSK